MSIETQTFHYNDLEKYSIDITIGDILLLLQVYHFPLSSASVISGYRARLGILGSRVQTRLR